MKKKHRLLSLTLSLAMISTLFPFTKAEKIEAAVTTSETRVLNGGTHTLSNITINADQGKSAVVIQGNVTLNIEGNVNLNGGNAYYKNKDNSDEIISIGAGAGIEVEAGATLTLKGSGTLNAKGGNAANGQTGSTPYKEDTGFNRGGRGGGGAGAGIGSRGADNPKDINTSGNINISDKKLQVNAFGGKGGNGGTGGTGGKAYTYKYEDFNDPTVLSRTQYIWQSGGTGGQGGGGGGYPAAGIGTGGAAGGDGGNGGIGGLDRAETSLLYTFTFYIGTTGWYTASGGGGGAGGEGYVNGGGGGGGGLDSGKYNPVYGGYKDYTTGQGGTGEVPNGGKPGTAGQPEKASVNGHGVTSGQPGRGTIPGAAGTGSDNRKKGLAGNNNYSAGKKAGAGSIILNGGSIYAKAGASTAQHIGTGDGKGTASGKLVVKGGVLTTDSGNNTLTPTNGSQQVYPVALNPKNYSSSVKTTNIKINGEDWNASRFSSNRTDGALIIWLPNGTYKAAIANSDYIYDMEYNISVNNGSVTKEVLTKSDAVLDISKGSIVFNKGSYTMNGNTTQGYSGTAYITGSSSKNNISFGKDSGSHHIILQNAEFNQLDISTTVTDTTSTQVNLESQGKKNHINIANIAASNSNITFTGDEDSEIKIDKIQGGNGSNIQDCYGREFKYVKDIAVAHSSKSAEDAVQKLINNGYSAGISNVGNNNIRGSTTMDLNKGVSNSDWVFIGYQTTTDPKEAIYELIAWYGNSGNDAIDANAPGEIFTDGLLGNTKYKRIKNIGDSNGNLNQGTKGDIIYLYESPYDKNQEKKKPITNLAVVNNGSNGVSKNDYKTRLNNSQYNSEWFPEIVGWRDHVEIQRNSAADLTHGTGGKDFIYLVYGKDAPEFGKGVPEMYYSNTLKDMIPTAEDEVKMIDDNKEHHSGSIVMDSFGKVHVGEIFSYGRATGTGSFGTLRKDSFWGTPSLAVNKGYFILDTYLTSQNKLVSLSFTSAPIVPNAGGLAEPVKYWWWSWNFTKVVNFYGNNTIGDVTVNGGTLQIGENGTGNMNIPSEFGQYSGGTVKVNPGGNLLAGNVAKLASNQNKVEITGLPKNSHLKKIQNIDENGYLGSFANQDIWTNNNGNYITYLPGNSGVKDVIFEDEAGYAYKYQISADTSGTTSESRVYLNDLSNYAPSGDNIRIQSKYIVDGNTLYKHDSTSTLSFYKPPNDVAKNINLNDEMNLKLQTMNPYTISKIHGKGNLTLTGKGLKITNGIDLPSVQIERGAITTPSINGAVTILGGSVKTNAPIMNAQGKDGPVYQAVIPTWDNNVLVDSVSYPIYETNNYPDSRFQIGHGDGYMYLYVPKDAKVVEAGNNYYTLKFNEHSQTMTVTRRPDRIGNIDISVGSLEIIDSSQYIYNGELYRNPNGTQYTIYGSSNVNTITVDAGNPQITFKDVSITPDQGSAMDIKSGSASIILTGKNTLSSRNSAAIHVPKGTSVAISGNGQLSGSGESDSAVIGGNYSEVNGKITISGGTLDLNNGDRVAIGAGVKASTPVDSILVKGGSINASMGTSPINASGNTLTRLVMEVKNGNGVQVDSNDYSIGTADKDGKLYLYMISGSHTVISGGTTYHVVPLNMTVPTNGSIDLALVDSKGVETKLNNKDMVVEGSNVKLNTTPDDGYGLKDGLSSGTYQVISENGELIFKPYAGYSNEADLSQWTPKFVLTEDEKVSSLKGYEKTIQDSEMLHVGVSQNGNAVLKFQATGSDMKANVKINGETKKTFSLNGTLTPYEYTWESKGDEVVTIEFVGSGKVTLSQVFLSRTMGVTKLITEFEETYTVKLPDINMEESNQNEDNGYVLALNEDGTNVIDRNPAMDGVQVFKNQKIVLRYLDPDGGSIFDDFTLNVNGVLQKVKQNPYQFSVNNDVEIKVTTHLEPFYSVNIPESVTLGEKESIVDIKAEELKNMQSNDSLEVSIHGLDGNGNAILTRIEDTNKNTLLVPIKNSSDALLKNQDVVARYQNNDKTAIFGGQIKLQPITGIKKAGDYTGNITFHFKYTNGN